MPQTPRFARKMNELAHLEMPYFQVIGHPKYLARPADACDFAFGNPQDMPLPGYVAALQKWSKPDSKVMAKAFAGLATPNSLLMHAIEDIEELCIDLNQIEHRRDRLYNALREIGYQVHRPEGTFYMLPKSPIEDDWKFFDILAEQNIIVLPGTVVDLPGYFRLSLTANDEMVERSIAGFAKAFAVAQQVSVK